MARSAPLGTARRRTAPPRFDKTVGTGKPTKRLPKLPTPPRTETARPLTYRRRSVGLNRARQMRVGRFDQSDPAGAVERRVLGAGRLSARQHPLPDPPRSRIFGVARPPRPARQSVRPNQHIQIRDKPRAKTAQKPRNAVRLSVAVYTAPALAFPFCLGRRAATALARVAPPVIRAPVLLTRRGSP